MAQWQNAHEFITSATNPARTNPFGQASVGIDLLLEGKRRVVSRDRVYRNAGLRRGSA